MSKTDLKYTEEQWKQLTETANQLFNAGAMGESISTYTTAFAKAEQLAFHAKSCIAFGIPVMPVFIISCNNLSHAYEKTGNRSRADTMLRRAVFFMVHVSEQEGLSDETRESVRRQLARTVLAYCNFCKKTNQQQKWDDFIYHLKAYHHYA